MILHIRNMEGDRCIAFVKQELDRLGLHCKRMELGAVELKEKISREKLQYIDKALKRVGLELIKDKKLHLMERIMEAMHKFIYLSDDAQKTSISSFMAKEVGCDYAIISKLFSDENGTTIEKYIIAKKIERVKDILVYEDLTLTEIAYKMQYSSVAHLSNQFKKITGVTPTFFRKISIVRRGDKPSIQTFAIKNTFNHEYR